MQSLEVEGERSECDKVGFNHRWRPIGRREDSRWSSDRVVGELGLTARNMMSSRRLLGRQVAVRIVQSAQKVSDKGREVWIWS
jgi:hypothetical protein